MSLAEDLRRDFPLLYPATLNEWMLEAPEGWRDLLYELSRRINGKPGQVQQVKSKFGGLRYYYRERDNEVTAAIRDAVAAAWMTCEVCGAAGALRREGSWWLMVRCEEHADGAEVIERYRDRETALASIRAHDGTVSQAGITAVVELEKAGYHIGPEIDGGCVSVRRIGNNDDVAWVDVGNTESEATGHCFST
jgi:hypothetical protein